MDSKSDFRSILPFLPVIFRSSAIFWPASVVEALKSLSKGPSHSNVNSGQLFALAVDDLRNSLGHCPMNPSALLGFSLFFDDLMNKDEADKWFQQVIPRVADLLLKLPNLLDSHYQNVGASNGTTTCLRLLRSQQPGIVFLSQELIAALLGCALFCLFPTTDRGAEHLPPINFDDLFACLYEFYQMCQENKIKCIVHYFEKICSNMPVGNVSFERKVLHLDNSPSDTAYPDADFWSNSILPLCQFEVQTTGSIEDQSVEAVEVDFANKYIGGGALSQGCVQEEIRFMINPELIVGTLFLPSMADNEAIEIVGPERFSNYTGYAKSFRFYGDHADQKGVDIVGRRRTRITAIDALCNPGKRQYRLQCLLRETNKAFCGFLLNQPKSTDDVLTAKQENDEIGVATGNWGCGAFGGDPELKVAIQWLAVSQAQRPFIVYYTFGLVPLQKLERVARWVRSQEWTVGELWNILVEYSTQRLRGEIVVGFFRWLIPAFYDDDDDDDDDPMVVECSISQSNF